MRNQWVLWSVLVLLSACSNSQDLPPSSASLISLEAASQLSLASGDGAFGNVAGNKIQVFAITNVGDSESELPAPALVGSQAASFSLIHTSGCAAPLAPAMTCFVRVQFNSVGKSEGAYSADLKIGASLMIPLSATVEASATASLVLQENNISVAALNLGAISRTQVSSKLLSIKNNSQAVAAPLNLSVNSNAFTLAANTCAGKALKPNQTCSFKVLFSTANKTPGTFLADLEFDSVVIPLSGTVLSIPPAGSPESSVAIETLVNNESLTTEDLELGLFPNNQGMVKVITFKNTGSATSEPLNAILSAPEAYSLISNTCVNKVLTAGASCSVRLVFSALNKPAGDYYVDLSFANAATTVHAAVLNSNSCPTNFHLSAPTCINNVQACDYVNGTGQKIWQGSAYGACNPIACNSGYDLLNNSCLTACAVDEHRHPATLACEDNVISCVGEISNAASATKTWNGSAYGSCQLGTCASNYHASENACVSNLQDCTEEIPGATAAAKLWNGSSYNACQVSACAAGFTNVTNMCSPNSSATAQASFLPAASGLNCVANDGLCYRANPPGSYQFEVPAGVYHLMVIGSGGGGGGGGAGNSSSGGGGGGSGAHYSRELLAVTPGEIYTINLGQGGAGGYGPYNATMGENTTIYRGASLIFSWQGGNGGKAGLNGGGTGAVALGMGNGGNGGGGASPGYNGAAGNVGALTIFSGVIAGTYSAPYGSGGGGGGGGASLGNGGAANHVAGGVSANATCGGGGGASNANHGGPPPWSFAGAPGCVYIYY